jgi:hypothetical protein
MSNLFSLNLNDFWKGLIVTVLMAVLTTTYEVIGAGSLAINWQSVLIAGLGAGIAYLIKNLGTDSTGKFLGSIQL